MKNFLNKLAETKTESIAHDGSLMMDGNVFIRIYKKYRKAFVGILLVVLLVPSIVFARYGGENGMIFALVLFSFIGLTALVEVTNNFRISRFGQLIIILMYLWSVFTPFKLLVDISESSGSEPATVFFKDAYPWYMFVSFAIASLVFIFDHSKDMKVSFQIQRYFYVLFTLIMASGMVKAMFILSIHWTHILALTFCVVIFVDTFATFFGKRLRKWLPYKLAPKASPNKTIIGAVCGVIGGAALFITVSYTTDIWDPYLVDGQSIHLWIIGSGIGLPIAAVIGDLFFSKMKRLIGIKDFSSLISGHGGIFDRMDSHAFVFTILGLLFLAYSYLY